MLHYYFKTTLRHLYKNKLYVLINTLGLGVGLACTVLAFYNYIHFADFNRMFDRYARTYLVTSQVEDASRDLSISPLPLGPAMAHDLPDVEAYSRFCEYYAYVRHEDQELHIPVKHADPDFLEMFSLEAVAGDVSAFGVPGQVILGLGAANDLFGKDVDPVGKSLRVSYDAEGGAHDLIVGAVVEVPANCSFRIGILAPFDLYMDTWGEDANNWAAFSQSTFVRLQEGSAAQRFADGAGKYLFSGSKDERTGEVAAAFGPVADWLEGYVVRQRGTKTDLPIIGLGLIPMHELGMRQLSHNRLVQSHPMAVYIPTTIALLILLLGIFNFVNMTLATAGQRLKEVGIRKVAGGHRWQLIIQLLSETLAVTLFALAVGVAFGDILTGYYLQMWGAPPELSITGKDWRFGAFLVGLTVSVAAVSGLYPALYVTAFEPVEILRGKARFGGASFMNKALITLQFSIAFLAMLASFTFLSNNEFMKSFDRNYAHFELLVVPLHKPAHLAVFEQKMAQEPSVMQIGRTRDHMLFGSREKRVKHGDTDYKPDFYQVGIDYLEVMDIGLLAGQSFEQLPAGQRGTATIINEGLAQGMGLTPETAVGAQLNGSDGTYTVVGVMPDINADVTAHQHRTMLALAPDTALTHLVARVRQDQIREANLRLQSLWHETFPENGYAGYINSELNNNVDQVLGNLSKMCGFMALIAMGLSAIGLFSVVSLQISKKLKEIAVRKIVGASARDLIGLINRGYIYLLAIALLAGLGLGTLALQGMLDELFARHGGIPPSVYVATLATVGFTSAMTVAWKIRYTIHVNPAEILRND